MVFALVILQLLFGIGLGVTFGIKEDAIMKDAAHAHPITEIFAYIGVGGLF